ncbi:MAG: Cof-type HAD-IIB family hydrolase [Kiritimatiellae bacterium]|nr:Cof-type HAD-IIB family hydrolase [Kiritimatiellia bacterium]
MGKFDGVMLVSDFDDTLTDRNSHISSENIKAIEYFVSRGGTFTVNTGRAPASFVARHGEIPINAPVILSNGAIIHDFAKNETLFHSWLDLRVREDCAAIAERFPTVAFEAYHGETIYVHKPNKASLYHLEKMKLAYTVCPIEQMELAWNKVIFEQEHSELLKVQAYVKENFADRYEVVFSNPILLELTAVGCNKGTTMLRLADMLGISREHVYAAGDNQNDLSMLRLAKMGFAPADCDIALKEWGAKLVSASDNHPVRDIVAVLDELY